jgi:iron(III) transport system ATP-binding protein
MTQIDLENLTKRYAGAEGDQAALLGLNLAVAAGEFVTLLGPSGCGKTTTLRLIAGYLTPDAGSISVAGRLLSSPKAVVPPEARGMGMVFQNYAVWPHKTVFENVVFGLKIRRVAGAAAREKVARVLDLVNLAGLERRYPSELSGGQQQRVALARSLVVEPAILLLDEPLSNLDAKLRERMRTELKQLQRRTGITFIYVTHDQSEALALSDRIAVMHQGRLQQYGTPREVYRRPANRVVADFMGLVNFVPAQVRETPSGGLVVAAGPLLLAMELPAGIRAGDRVDLAIRPESIHLTALEAAQSGFRARIEEHNYLGNLTEYVVALGDLRLRVQASSDADFAPGAEALLSIDTGRCKVFGGGDIS